MELEGGKKGWILPMVMFLYSLIEMIWAIYFHTRKNSLDHNSVGFIDHGLTHVSYGVGIST